jgi:hypothetical protein
MENFSIIPALTLMLPALGPFFLTLLLLLGIRFLAPPGKSLPILDDLAILSGILLAFGLFDPASLTHFSNPERPMDWIPDLTASTFLLRTAISRLSGSWITRLLPELAAIAAACVILLLPLLRQHSLGSALVKLAVTLLVWGTIRLSFFDRERTGLPPPVLLAIFLVLATLSFVSPLSGSLLLGQLAGGLAAVMAATFLATLIRGIRVSGVETGLALGALLLVGRYYVEIPPSVLSGLLSGLLASAIGFLVLRKIHLPGRTARVGLFLVPALLSAIPLGIAIWQALRNLPARGAGY